MRRITLYTKPGCHLCEAVEQVIERAGGRYAFKLHRVNILEDTQSFDRYKNDIPVVLLDGKEIARHRLTMTDLDRFLRS